MSQNWKTLVNGFQPPKPSIAKTCFLTVFVPWIRPAPRGEFLEGGDVQKQTSTGRSTSST